MWNVEGRIPHSAFDIQHSTFHIPKFQIQRRRTLRFGMHLTFSSGPALAKTLGCQALQIFCGNPRGWLKTPLDEDFIKSFRAGVAEAKLDPVIVHATYLINLAARDDAIYQKSSDAFVTELNRSKQLGARF